MINGFHILLITAKVIANYTVSKKKIRLPLPSFICKKINHLQLQKHTVTVIHIKYLHRHTLLRPP